MKIGIISDTHDHLENTQKAFEVIKEQKVELVCHLGDWISPFTFDFVDKQAKQLEVPVMGVLGNNDNGSILQHTNRWNIDLQTHTNSFTADDKNIILYHGTDEQTTNALIKSNKYDAVFTGHTHEPEQALSDNTLSLNPGTLSNYSTKRGIIKRGELAVYDTRKHKGRLLTFPLQ